MGMKILCDEYLLKEVADTHRPESVSHLVTQICSVYGERNTQ